MSDKVLALPLSKEELSEMQSLIKTLGYNAKRNPQTLTITNPALGSGENSVFVRCDNNPDGMHIALSLLRAKVAGNRASAPSADDTPQDNATPIVVGLAEQRAELSASGGAIDTTLGELIANGDGVVYNGTHYPASAYPGYLAARKNNPPWDKADATPQERADNQAKWTTEQRNARQAFLICQAFERKYRKIARDNGTLPSATPRNTGTDSASATTAKRATPSASASAPAPTLTARATLALLPAYLDSATLGDIRFVVAPSALNPTAGDLSWLQVSATLGERLAAETTIPDDNADTFANVGYYAEHPAWQKSKEIVARDNAIGSLANIPAQVMADARELAAELERDVWVIGVGGVASVALVTRAKLQARHANDQTAYLLARATPDGGFIRLSQPESLYVATPPSATIPASILAQTSASVDPASVANVVTPDSASGMTATETERASASATPQDSAPADTPQDTPIAAK